MHSHDDGDGERSPLPTERSRLLPRNPSPHDETSLERQSDTSSSKNVTLLQGVLATLAMGISLCIHTANMSLLTTIQSPIADDLDAHDSVSWFASTYLIAASCILPLAGRLCGVFTTRRYILFSSILFGIGQVVTAIAPSLAVFLLGRALSGIGAASNFPIANIVVINVVPIRRRGLFMGLLNTSFTLGVSGGAIIAGAIEPVIGWRTVFAVQVPIIVVCGIIVFFTLPDFPLSLGSEQKTTPTPLSKIHKELDILGVLTLASFIILFLLGVSAPSGILYAPLGISFVFLAAFIFVEAEYAPNPIITVRLLKSRALLMTSFATVLLMMARWVVLFFTPIYATAVRSWSPAKSGAILIASNGGFASGSLVSGTLHVKRTGSFYIHTIIVFVFFAASLFALGESTSITTAIWKFLLAAFTNGFFTGAALVYGLAHLLHRTSTDDHFVATALAVFFRGLAGPFASSAGGGLFARTLKHSLEQGFKGHHFAHKDELIHRLLGSPRLVQDLTGYQRDVAVNGYSEAIKMLMLAGSAITLLATVFQACTGWKEYGESGKKPVTDDGDEQSNDS